MNHSNSSHALVLTTRVWELLPFQFEFLHELRQIPEILIGYLTAAMTTV